MSHRRTDTVKSVHSHAHSDSEDSGDEGSEHTEQAEEEQSSAPPPAAGINNAERDEIEELLSVRN